ncbi:recombinase family protein [Shimia thalassica]|uniref:recombinase family protein n=1 Tax=Shimia thalassica TaxID=1715693 RepID=UPI0027331F70|nr:recombinase family protein [Shimia thalassica]MDP2581328.1 recombinase family protein [Shimia thalassica]
MSFPFGQKDPGTPQSAILYARVSSNRQAENDLSIPDQLRRMRAFCKLIGIKVVHEYKDARTGREMSGRSIEEIIDLVENGSEQITMLIVHSFSRLARDAYEAEGVRRRLEGCGVQIVSITQPIEDSPVGNLLRQVINVFDEYTSNEIAKHVTRTMTLNAEQGYWNGGVPPFGYFAADAGTRGKKTKKKLAVDPSESEDIRLIFTLYLDGDGRSGPMGVKKVAQWMNANGYARRGKHWTTGQLHRVLTDTIYIGEHVFGKSKPKDAQIIVQVPAIVEVAIFNKVQARLRKHHPLKIAPRKVGSPILLTGTARCGHCGGGMVLATGKSNQYRYYTCSNRKRKGKSVCGGQNVPMVELDGIVTDALVCALIDEGRSHQVLEALSQRMDARNIDEKSRAAELQRVLKDQEQAVVRLYQGIETGLFDLNDELFKDQYQTACSERDIVRAKLEVLTRDKDLRMRMSPVQIAEFGSFLRNALQDGPIAFRKRYVETFLRSVIVTDDEIHLVPRNEAGKPRADQNGRGLKNSCVEFEPSGVSR